MRYFILVLALFSLATSVYANNKQTSSNFENHITPIPPAIEKQMRLYTWHQDCPVPLSDLVYIKLSYWGFDNKKHNGELIINKQLASEVVDIFKTLYVNKFPIQSMELMDKFKGDDDASLKANNTSSFNCRAVTGHPGVYSQHSYGRAIDINPLINPYVKNNLVLPPEGAQYINRDIPTPGKITRDNLIYKEFTENQWVWGGNWHDLQDYQHFEKRANNEKRDSNGYPAANKKI